jgi:hypothetical protein
MNNLTPLTSRGDKPLSFTFQHQLEALIFFHLQGFESGAALLQAMEEDGFAKQHIAPPDGVRKSTFYEAINDRGLVQLQELFMQLCQDAGAVVPRKFEKLGDLVAVNSSLAGDIRITENSISGRKKTDILSAVSKRERSRS